MKHGTGFLSREETGKVSRDGCFCAWLSVDIASFLWDCFIIKSDTLEDFYLWRKVESQFALFILSRKNQKRCGKRFSKVNIASSSCSKSGSNFCLRFLESTLQQSLFLSALIEIRYQASFYFVCLSQKIQQLFKQRCEWVCVHCQMLCKYDGSMK